MRTTCITRLNVERHVAYDPDFHGLVNRDITIDLFFEEGVEGKAVVRMKLDIKYVTEAKDLFGTLTVEARTELKGVELAWTAEGKPDFEKTPENVLRLIEGGLAEDVLLPASVAARAVHLPSVLPIPNLFPRKGKGKTVPAGETPQEVPG